MKHWRNGAKISGFVRRSKDTTMPSRWREHPEVAGWGFLLRIDRTDLKAGEAWLMYMTLTRAENALTEAT